MTCSCSHALLPLGHDRDGHALSMLLIRERGWGRDDARTVQALPDDELLRIREVGPRRLADLRARLSAALAR